MFDRIETPAPGVYDDAADYYRWDAISQSSLFDLDNSCPAMWQWRREHPRAATAAMDLGKATHELIQRPFDFAGKYAVAPECDKRTKAGKEQWQAAMAAGAGKTIISQEDYESASGMAKAISAHPTAMKALYGGRREVALVWDDPQTGVRCKALVDTLKPRCLVDLKTTRSANPDEFVRSIWDYGYHVQAAFYQQGAAACGLGDLPFLWIAVESAPPHLVIVRFAGKTVIELGRMVIGRGLSTIKHCRETGEWPGYADTNIPLEMPKWALAREGLTEAIL